MAGMDLNTVQQDLIRRFAAPLPEFYKRRIIFWYDEDREFEDQLDDMPDYRVAVYIRLSNADEETGSKKDESNSVVHQRMLLNRYLDQKEELKSCPRTEFVEM